MSGTYGYGEPADWGSDGVQSSGWGGFSIQDTIGGALSTWAAIEQAKLNARLAVTTEQAKQLTTPAKSSNPQSQGGQLVSGVGGVSWGVVALGLAGVVALALVLKR